MLSGRREGKGQPRGDLAVCQSFGDQGEYGALSGRWRHAALQDKFEMYSVDAARRDGARPLRHAEAQTPVPWRTSKAAFRYEPVVIAFDEIRF
jgi:hypothetical protein